MIDSSRNVIETTAIWGDSLACDPIFLPDDCWALGRGVRIWSVIRNPDWSVRMLRVMGSTRNLHTNVGRVRNAGFLALAEAGQVTLQ